MDYQHYSGPTISYGAYKRNERGKMDVPESYSKYREGDRVNVFDSVEDKWYNHGVVVATELAYEPDCLMVHFPVRNIIHVPENIIVEQSHVRFLF